MRTPVKVETLAREMGVEEECLLAGPSGACSECYDIVMRAFDSFYADVPPDRVRTQIATDGYA